MQDVIARVFLLRSSRRYFGRIQGNSTIRTRQHWNSLPRIFYLITHAVEPRSCSPGGWIDSVVPSVQYPILNNARLKKIADLVDVWRLFNRLHSFGALKRRETAFPALFWHWSETYVSALNGDSEDICQSYIV